MLFIGATDVLTVVVRDRVTYSKTLPCLRFFLTNVFLNELLLQKVFLLLCQNAM